MFGITELISKFFGAATAFFGFQSKKLDLNNTAPLEKAAIAQEERDAINATESAVSKKDVDEIRKLIGE